LPSRPTKEVAQVSPNVYDQAHILASSLKTSTEYADYKLALTKLKAETGTARIFRDFRKRQFDLQSRLLQGQDVPVAERERFAQLSEIIAQHGPISAFLGAEFRLSRLLGDIQRIIADAVELEMGIGPDEEEDQAAGEPPMDDTGSQAAETQTGQGVAPTPEVQSGKSGDAPRSHGGVADTTAPEPPGPSS
jgi:cell fate (sporulation/competence/biofilm development) regulator YlbF (YheA/YmcA/DUF963 family)